MLMLFVNLFLHSIFLLVTCSSSLSMDRPTPLDLDCKQKTVQLAEVDRKNRIKRSKRLKKLKKSRKQKLSRKPTAVNREIQWRAANDLETVKDMTSCWGSVQQNN
ncbi:hypothetical protein DICVIV_04146 [Dictyocaulus viviparus]|uniref:Secreted protein n=1 Tax=Dictyocaulus viviparus TaxID=29172 RepID=A0A0D8XZ46_DICVI|nr:hypothetical protein DICVIV_04146 [Dictyocaulus viviparus]